MANEKTGQTEVLVLNDDKGSFYAIPKDVLEKYHLSPDQKAKLEEHLGDDVSGYAMMFSQVMGAPVADNPIMRERKVEQPVTALPAAEHPLGSKPASELPNRDAVMGRFASVSNSIMDSLLG